MTVKQGLSFRRGFFVGLVGLSFGLALASGMLALMERVGLRSGLNATLDRLAQEQTEVVGDRRLGLSTEQNLPQDLTASLSADSTRPLQNPYPAPSATLSQTERDATSSQIGLITDNAVLAIPALDQTRRSAMGLPSPLDGEELALADVSANSVSLGDNQTITALLQTLEPEAPKPAGVQVAQAGAAAVTTAFRSTATLKALPSGRQMSWVTPGLAMNEQHNPLYLDQRGYCALTFDDGPDRIKDNRIMDILRNEGVKATFFVLGNKLKGAEATIARMLAEGHEVGNHSWSHPQLTKLSHDKAQNQVERTSRALEKLGAVVRVFRPPYGAQNSRVRQISQDLGMHVMLWDVDSLDWKVRRAASIRSEIANTSDRGSVVLMHSHVNGTVEALPQIIADLRAKGCTFVTASQWFDGLNAKGLPLPQQRKRVARKPKPAVDPVVPAPKAPSTSYQWDPNPVPSYPAKPSQPATNEPIYIY